METIQYHKCGNQFSGANFDSNTQHKNLNLNGSQNNLVFAGSKSISSGDIKSSKNHGKVKIAVKFKVWIIR